MSAINPNNINSAYPIAGQDNDSQGFRDNFTNIKNNLTFTKTEMEDLQGKVLLKSALDGTTLANDMSNQKFSGIQLERFTQTFNDIPGGSGSIEISWLEGHFQRIDATAPVDLTFTDWAPAGSYGAMRVEITVVNALDTITLPAGLVGLSEIDGIDDRVITAVSAGKVFVFEFGSFDNGTTVSVRQLLGSNRGMKFGDLGILTGANIISRADGQLQRIETSGSLDLSFIDWAPVNHYDSMRLMINVTNVAHTITLAAEVDTGLAVVPGAAAQVITAASTGEQLFEFSTFDNGSSIIIIPLIQTV